MMIFSASSGRRGRTVGPPTLRDPPAAELQNGGSRPCMRRRVRVRARELQLEDHWRTGPPIGGSRSVRVEEGTGEAGHARPQARGGVMSAQIAKQSLSGD